MKLRDIALYTALTCVHGCYRSGFEIGQPLDDAATRGPIVVSNLRALWTTPNQIRWQWDESGDGDRLLRYEVVTAKSAVDLQSRTGTAVIWDESEKPELGAFLGGGGDPVPVVSTFTDALAPDTVYYAEVTAFDVNGNDSTSPAVSARTAVSPTNSLWVFSETDPAGSALPATYVLSDNAPYAGTYHLEFTPTGCAPDCTNNLQRYGVGIDVSAMNQADYDTTAYAEFAVANSGSDSLWTEFYLWFGDGTTEEPIIRYQGWSLRSDGQYRLVQVPLRFMTKGSSGVPTSFAVMTGGLHNFTVGGEWTEGQPVRFDEFWIRW